MNEAEEHRAFIARLRASIELPLTPRGRGRRCAACGQRRTAISVMVLARRSHIDRVFARPKTVQLDSRSRTFCQPCAAVLYQELFDTIEAFPGYPPDGGRTAE